MKLYKKTIIASALLLVFFSCKKENNIQPQPEPLPADTLQTMDATQSTAAVAALITNLKSGTSKTYQLGTIAVNTVYYTDRTYKITSLPSSVSGGVYIRAACDDKNNRSSTAISFTLNQSATVYIAYDSRADAIPNWLSGWTKLTDKIGVSGDVGTLNLYKKDYAAGGVSLGGNLASPAADVFSQYVVIAKVKTSTGEETAPVNGAFMLGINGHSLSSHAYTPVSGSQQIAMIKKMGMSIYRLDISFNSDGSIPNSSVFNPLYSAAAASGVTILPMIYPKTLNLNKSESQAYNSGKILGTNVAAKNSKYFKYYELGNELDNSVILSARDGNQSSDYDSRKFKVTAAYLKGMNDGIKSVQSSAKTMIDAGWLHYAFLQMLQTYGVKFDIIAYHWYSDMEGAAKGKGIPDITRKLSGLFTKPIWFTEVGQRYKKVSNMDQMQSDFTNMFIKKCKANSQVKSLQFYELIDQPERVSIEGNFGFVRWTKPYSAWAYKTVAKSLF